MADGSISAVTGDLDGVYGFVHPEAGWISVDADVDAEWMAVRFESDATPIVMDAQGRNVPEREWTPPMQRGVERFREQWFEEQEDRR